MVPVGASSLWVKVVVWVNRGKDIWGPSHVGPLPTKIILGILKKINVLIDHKAFEIFFVMYLEGTLQLWIFHLEQERVLTLFFKSDLTFTWMQNWFHS